MGTDGSRDYRSFERIPYNAPILFSYLGSSRHLEGEMRNFGPFGFYFETDNEVPEGTEIYIKMVEVPSFWKDLGFDGGCRGKVMWCENISQSRNNNNCYGIGVQIDWLGNVLSMIRKHVAD